MVFPFVAEELFQNFLKLFSQSGNTYFKKVFHHSHTTLYNFKWLITNSVQQCAKLQHKIISLWILKEVFPSLLNNRDFSINYLCRASRNYFFLHFFKIGACTCTTHLLILFLFINTLQKILHLQCNRILSSFPHLNRPNLTSFKIIEDTRVLCVNYTGSPYSLVQIAIGQVNQCKWSDLSKCPLGRALVA